MSLRRKSHLHPMMKGVPVRMALCGIWSMREREVVKCTEGA